MDKQRGFVAVVDDDHRMREALEDLLESVGYNVLAFSSATMFLESHAVFVSSCVISDIRMPGMNGREFTKHIQTIDPKVPVILITAEIDFDPTGTGGSLSPQLCFTKPVDCKKLLAAVHRIFREVGRPENCV